MQPMNYTIQTGNPGEAFEQGMNRTAGMMATVADFQKAQALATAAQQKAEHDAYKRQRFQEAVQNPTSKSVQGLLLEFPELHEGLSKSLEFMSKDEKKNAQEMSFSILTALEKGKPDSAVAVIDQQLEAAKRNGSQDQIQRLEMLRDGIIASPEATRFGLKGMLFASLGGKDYGDLMKNLGEEDRAQELQPMKVAEAKSNSEIAAVKAKFAESEAAIDLQKKGWDITKIQEDIKINKLNSQIAAMNAQTSRMNSGIAAQGNNLKMQENQIKLQELIDKRDSEVRAKVAKAESARASIDNFLNTADRLVANPMLPRVLGTIEGRVTSAPLSDQAADAIALIDTLKSQAFLSQIPSIKGTGNLSEKEGDKIQAALTNLSRVQSEKQFMANLNEAKRLLIKARSNQAKELGIPDTVPDTPAANSKSSGKSTDQILKELGVVK